MTIDSGKTPVQSQLLLPAPGKRSMVKLTASDCFAQYDHVGLNTRLILISQISSGPSIPCLNLVADEQHVVLST